MDARRRAKRAGGERRVGVRFEPHRLAQECLEQAYAQVVPPIQRRLMTTTGDEGAAARGARRQVRAGGER